MDRVRPLRGVIRQGGVDQQLTCVGQREHAGAERAEGGPDEIHRLLDPRDGTASDDRHAPPAIGDHQGPR
jgi:hypothetical protein